MRLTAKLVLVIMLGVTLLITAHGYLMVHRQDRQLKDKMEIEAIILGRAVRREVVAAWNRSGHLGVRNLLNTVNSTQEHVVVRWVFLNATGEFRPIVDSEELLALRPTPDEIIRVTRRTEQGQGYLHTYYPIGVGFGVPTYLEITGSLDEVDRYTRETIYQTVGLVVAILACGLFVSLIGVRFVGEPLETLIQKTKRIGKGDFSGPIELSGQDEFSQLAEALNQLCVQLAESRDKVRAETSARITAVEQLRHADRLKTIGRLASGLAHEMGTPLNVVSGRAELIASGRLSEEEILGSAATIKSEAERMTGIIRQLLDFARRGTPKRQSADLRHVVRQSVDLLSTMAKRQDVTLSVSIDRRAWIVPIEVGQIQQVVMNLIVNAIQAMSDGGEIRIGLSETTARRPEQPDADASTYYRLLVEDQGVGMSRETIEHVFEPFFTTKETGEGTGLGLSVSYGIVQDHEGWIEVESEPGRGSRFAVYLPAQAAPAARGSANADGSADTGAAAAPDGAVETTND